MMKETRLFDILKTYPIKYPDQKVVLAGRDQKTGAWVRYNIQDYVRITDNISYGLIKLGIMPGDKVIIVSNNRPEWNMIDMAAMQIGAISVPIYPTISDEDYIYNINNCGATILFIEGVNVMKVIDRIKSQLPLVKYIYTFSDREEYPYLAQLIELGEKNHAREELDKREEAVKPKDCATIIYTSGTTGVPKGVMLSHDNIISQLEALCPTPSKWSKTAYSFLPLCHAYERTIVYLYQYLGMSVYYAQNFGSVGQDIKELNPTMMSAVPRMLEKMYDKIIASGRKLKGIKRMIFFWAVAVAKKYEIEASDRTSFYNFKHKIADKLVYSQLRSNIGGHFDIIISGAASIQKHLVSFFSAIGMPVFEGYGLTETSPVVVVSSREKYSRAAGTVGFPLTDVEVKIDKDTNELCCRGRNVMLGYYNNEEMTKQVIDKDGWFHTGDMAKYTDRKQIVITGRIKSMFKTSLGKYINPGLIEGKFSESGFIDKIVVVGENQKFAGALIVPDFEFLQEWCNKHGMVYTNPHDIINNPVVIQRYRKEVDKYNEFFGSTEKIKKFELLADDWNQQNEMLTPTLKVRRKIVIEKYKSVIDNMYNVSD